VVDVMRQPGRDGEAVGLGGALMGLHGRQGLVHAELVGEVVEGRRLGEVADEVDACLPSRRYRTAQYLVPSAFVRSRIDAMTGIGDPVVDAVC
jgi:hypothetical protein